MSRDEKYVELGPDENNVLMGCSEQYGEFGRDAKYVELNHKETFVEFGDDEIHIELSHGRLHMSSGAFRWYYFFYFITSYSYLR